MEWQIGPSVSITANAVIVIVVVTTTTTNATTATTTTVTIATTAITTTSTELFIRKIGRYWNRATSSREIRIVSWTTE